MIAIARALAPPGRRPVAPRRALLGVASLGLVVASSARGAPALAGELAGAACPPGMLFVPGGSSPRPRRCRRS